MRQLTLADYAAMKDMEQYMLQFMGSRAPLADMANPVMSMDDQEEGEDNLMQMAAGYR